MATYKENTVEFGVCNVHYAKATYESETKTYSYETPKAMPGCVSISLPASGSIDPTYADNIKYYISETNNGYDGNATFLKIPDSFMEDIFGETNGVENADTKSAEFALMFEFDGDSNATRHLLYRCKATRPDIAGDTKEDKATPKKVQIAISVSPRLNDHVVKAKAKVSDSSYDTFYDAVTEPDKINVTPG